MASVLGSCAKCGGFVPEQAAACPHCEAPPDVPGWGVRLGKAALALAGGSVFAVTLAACYGGPARPMGTCADPSMDEDGDGYCGQLDCNETDMGIHANAVDPSGDGKDQNCDGSDGDVTP